LPLRIELQCFGSIFHCFEVFALELLPAMFGKQSIVMSRPRAFVYHVTEKDLDNQIQEAIEGDEEAAHIVQVRIDYSLKQPIVLVLKCLGVSEESTIGACHCGTFARLAEATQTHKQRKPPISSQIGGSTCAMMLQLQNEKFYVTMGGHR
jgi:hypothetical protein